MQSDKDIDDHSDQLCPPCDSTWHELEHLVEAPNEKEGAHLDSTSDQTHDKTIDSGLSWQDDSEDKSHLRPIAGREGSELKSVIEGSFVMETLVHTESKVISRAADARKGGNGKLKKQESKSLYKESGRIYRR